MSIYLDRRMWYLCGHKTFMYLDSFLYLIVLDVSFCDANTVSLWGAGHLLTYLAQ